MTGNIRKKRIESRKNGLIGMLGRERSVISPLIATGLNLLLIFVAYTFLRVEYLAENWSYFSPAAREGYLFSLLMAGPVFDTPGIFYLNMVYIFMMLLPLHWKEHRGYYRVCKWLFVIINSAGILANIADSVYFSYTLRRTTWDFFSEFSGDDNLWKIVGVELLRHWYLVVLSIVLIWGLWRLYSSPSPGANTGTDKKGRCRYYLLSVLGLAVGALTTVSAIRGGLLNHWWCYLLAGVSLYSGYIYLKDESRSKSSRVAGYLSIAAGCVFLAIAPIGGWRHRDIHPVAISNANRYIRRPYEAALVLNTPFTMIRTVNVTPFSDPHYMSDEEMAQIYTPVHHNSKANVDIGAEGKNVVVIILESFGREYIGSLNRGILGEDYKGYTPFIDSLVYVSATWEHSYDNGQKSIEAMPSVLAGIPGMVKPFVLTSAAMNKLEGLPAILSREGYETSFFHGARTGSMGFDGFARSIGFENYYGREDFDKEYRGSKADSFDGYWGIWDEPFLQYFAQKMGDMPQPFMTAVFTLSSHHPFNVPQKYEGVFPEGSLPIHKTIGYTDHALREFFETAKRQPWYANTIFVITNDHTNARSHDEYRSAISAFYGPILIFDPSGTLPRGPQPGIAQQTDIMPTVLGLVGADKDYVAFGKDLFTTLAEEGWAFSYNGVYQNVKYGYVLQWDGKKRVGLYKIDDHKMERNLLSTYPDIEAKMERELNAFIQQYMQHMVSDSLTR